MAKQKETAFKEKVQKDLLALQKAGRPIWRERIQQIAIVGTPDELLICGGWGIGLELKKSDKRKPKGAQKRKLENILKAGGYALRAAPENWPLLLKLIEEISLTDYMVDYRIRKTLWEQSCSLKSSTRANWLTIEAQSGGFEF